MARGQLKHPITPASLTSQGVTRKEYCAFPDLVEHHKQRVKINRATGLQPGRASPIGAVPDPIQRMGGR